MTSVLLVPAFSFLLLWLLPLAVIWIIGGVVYRLYSHPLAHIPGPWLAAVTHLYVFYYNAIAGGSRLYVQIEKLHEKYGPVVRISPNEIHLSDPENYGKIYSVGTKYLKSPEFYGSFGVPTSVFGAMDPELHRVRRAALNPHFSRKRVLELEEIIQSKVLKLCHKVADRLQDNKPVDIFHGYRAVTVDIITDYVFDNCYNLLDQADFGVGYSSMIRALAPTFWVFIQWPFLQTIAMKTPMWLAQRMNKPVGTYMQMQKTSREQIVAVKSAMDAAEGKPPTRVTVFHDLLRPDAEGHPVPAVDDLVDETLSIIGAGSETTGNALEMATYHILNNDNIYGKLTAEIKEAFPDPSLTLGFVTLEKLPYLTGVIKEALRLSYGIIGRLPRVTPRPGAVFNGYTIPPGSIVAMSSWMMHRNEAVFPTPDKFDPERWLDPESAKKLDKYLISFSKGTRQCVGMNLAYCELYVILGTFFRKFENLEVYNTGSEDMVYEDYFGPHHPLGARKLHIVSKAC